MGSDTGAVTPTREMVAMAERIADSYVAVRAAASWRVSKRAALTAIMEVSEQTEAWLDGEAQFHFATAIRNGEHLR